MAYRNGTYIAFHAAGTSDPTASDIKYFNIMKAWHHNDGVDFKFINSHEKVSAVRDSSTRDTLKRSLQVRLNNSKNMVLIVGDTTRLDIDWVPFEISYAVDKCSMPIIVAYTGYNSIMAPHELSGLWPPALEARINNGAVKAIHVPFNRRAIDDAISQFNIGNLPKTSLNYYTAEAHRSFGIRL
jgi:hypothetical protein